MKSAPKGIEMKLIQILALATAMATVATAQNSSANGQGKASPTPTPAAAAKTGGSAQPATKKAVATKTSAATPAKGTTDKTAAAKGASASSSSSKPAVKAATVPVKAHTTAGTQPKGVPTPVVAAHGTASATDPKKTETKKGETKKADTKKVDAKKGNGTKAPAVIAVRPAQPSKKTGAAAAAKKPAVKAAAPQVTQLGASTQAAEKPKPAPPRTFGAHGRRDPFVSPIVAKDGGINRPPSNCTSGKRCLVIPELILQGTIKDTSGKMMAVVANSIKKTYFLRENDQVFQGSVEKITSDSIIFREYVKDALGRETAREVVKKLVPAS
jgi:Tfp pilus assembly protein PilP